MISRSLFCKIEFRADKFISLIDVNECMQGVCDTNAMCEDTPGSFNCTCKPGYSGNGTSGNCYCEYNDNM